MGHFLTEDFLLPNEPARRLYHEYAAKMPIFDYHCHLSPQDMAANRRFENMTQIWLEGDHYKWRAMRAAGMEESFITGKAADKDKFLAWAQTVPKTIGNPLYHWTHLELKRPFGIERLLNPETAEGIWSSTQEQLSTDAFSSWGILKQMNVTLVCTTDDPVDSLESHKKMNSEASVDFKMYPTLRPDRAMAAGDPESYNSYLDKLGEVSGVEINSWSTLLEAMDKRHQSFHEAGCRLSDHGWEPPVFQDCSEEDLQRIFAKVRGGSPLEQDELVQLQSGFMLAMGRLNHQRNWVMQLHIGALRSTNTRMIRELGPNTGYDSIGDFPVALPLSRLLDGLERENNLPKTILYTLNPAWNEIFATMIGNFQGGGVPGKMQFGSGWWFNDLKTGMQQQLTSLANQGLLSSFVGMVTDSRSLLSYPRHEYFRRVLCSLIGGWVKAGEAPEDYHLLGKMVQDISYNNSETYFGFPQ